MTRDVASLVFRAERESEMLACLEAARAETDKASQGRQAGCTQNGRLDHQCWPTTLHRID